jgi:hypothetical protein
MDTRQVISRHLSERAFNYDYDGDFVVSPVSTDYHTGETYMRAFGRQPKLDINEDVKAYLRARFTMSPIVVENTRDLWVKG